MKKYVKNENEFNCSSNQLTSLPESIGSLINLYIFYCYSNKLTSLPLSIMNCRNLKYFRYFNNPIEHISPNLLRFLNRNKTFQNIYEDKQSVHNSSIQLSIKQSIENILKYKPIIQNLEEYISNDSILTIKSKNLLKEYFNNNDIHSLLQLTYKELCLYVFSRIEINENKEEIKKILNQELIDSEGMCFTGRISRLINCLNGFDKEINVSISDSEQIGNIISLIMKNKEIINKKEEIIKSLRELNYDEETINVWTYDF